MADYDFRHDLHCGSIPHFVFRDELLFRAPLPNQAGLFLRAAKGKTQGNDGKAWMKQGG